MPTLSAFMNLSLDGCFSDSNGEMSAFHSLHGDVEFQAFTKENARGGSRLVFGRRTYDMMAGYWPSSMAKQQNPVVAEQMNARQKIVFSRKMKAADWASTSVLNGDLADHREGRSPPRSNIHRHRHRPSPDHCVRLYFH